MLQHTDSYTTQHQSVITQSLAALDCLIIIHNLNGPRMLNWVSRGVMTGCGLHFTHDIVPLQLLL